MDPLRKLIENEISSHGPLRFDRFMALALYSPHTGYYEIPRRVGRQGDFFTSVSIGPTFGQWLAFAFASWLDTLDATGLQLVEAGADDGRLANDILTWLGLNRPDLMARVRYEMIEPSAERQKWQRSTLERFAGQVQWRTDWNSIVPKSIHGVIFSNELLDAMPVRRLGWSRGQHSWFEWAVTSRQDLLCWTRIDLDPGECRKLMQQAGVEIPAELEEVLPDDFTLDLSPAAVEWWRHAAEGLGGGKLLTIDYGIIAEEMLSPHRAQGTLRAYQGHQRRSDVLACPGQQDLTAHVNFTALRRTGETMGLHTEGLFSQEEFFVGLMRQAVAGKAASPLAADSAAAFQTLTHPQHLGRAFRVLVQMTYYTRSGAASS